MRHHRRGRNPDANKLIIYHNPTGSATFDPRITLSQAGTVIWETEVGRTVTIGTTHDLSYTPTAGAKICKVLVAGGLGLVTGIDCNTDSVTATRNIKKCISLASLTARTNPGWIVYVSDVPNATYIQTYNSTLLIGRILDLSRSLTYLSDASGVGLSGQVSDFPLTVQTMIVNGNSLISAASIAHLTAIRDLRIYSMGWTAQQNTDVLLSAWNARANYTYASGIQLRISAPTGTPGTEPPAEGESNADWSWNAGTSRHDPLTGYAVKADLENDFYTEGFKTWTVTIS